MRYQGRITTWKDDQGFGFITPNGGGDQVFVHIKTFSNRQRRPVGNELVTYELTADERQRPRAINVAYVGQRPVERSTAHVGWATTVFAIVFFVVIGAAVFRGRLTFAVFVAYVVASIVAFVAYAFDKAAARKAHWRTRERTLHLLGLIGGWPGALLAQKMFRHKSRKREFQTLFWVMVILNCALLVVFRDMLK